jgi:hypothetical protein
MPVFRPRQKKKDPGGLMRLPADSDAESMAEALPGITRHLASLAQKAAIRLYRKIHSHETGGFLSVRDEFLFLICYVFRVTLDTRYPKDDTARLWKAFQEQLNKTLLDLRENFDITAFWETESERSAGYGLFAPHEQERGVALSGPAVVSFFAECQMLHLGPDLHAKIRHFSEQILKELEREI